MTEASGPVCGQKVVLGAILRKKKSNEKKNEKTLVFALEKIEENGRKIHLKAD